MHCVERSLTARNCSSCEGVLLVLLFNHANTIASPCDWAADCSSPRSCRSSRVFKQTAVLSSVALPDREDSCRKAVMVCRSGGQAPVRGALGYEGRDVTKYLRHEAHYDKNSSTRLRLHVSTFEDDLVSLPLRTPFPFHSIIPSSNINLQLLAQHVDRDDLRRKSGELDSRRDD